MRRHDSGGGGGVKGRDRALLQTDDFSGGSQNILIFSTVNETENIQGLPILNAQVVVLNAGAAHLSSPKRFQETGV